LVGHLPGHEAAVHGPGPQLLDIDAPAIVGERDVEHAGPVTGLQSHGGERRLAGGRAFRRGFDAMVEGVADQVRERRLQLVEDVAVDARLLAAHLPANLLAQRAGQIANEPRKTANAFGQRPHAAGDHLVVKAVGEVLVPPGKALEFFHVSVQGRQAGVGPLADACKQCRDGGWQCRIAGLELVLERGQGVADVDLGGSQLEQRFDEGPELSCLHQGFPGQAHESGEAVRRDAHHAVGLFGSRRRGRRCGRRCPCRSRLHFRYGRWCGDRCRRGAGDVRFAGRCRAAVMAEEPGQIGHQTRGSFRPGAVGVQGVGRAGDRGQKVDGSQQQVGVFGLNAKSSRARRHEHVLEAVRHPHGRLQAHDPGCTLE